MSHAFLSHVVCVVILALWPKLADAQFARPVGVYGDMQQLQFDGQLTVDAQDLRDQLDSNLKVLQSSRPSMQLSSLLENIDSELLRGFVASGFPEATVSTQLDVGRNCLVTTIVEGRHYVRGEVLVNGVAQDLAEFVRQQLSPPEQPVVAIPAQLNPGTFKPTANVQLGEQKPQWSPETVCNFTPTALDSYRQAVVAALEQGGLLEPTLTLNLRRNTETGKADLVIDVISQGVPRLIAEIQVTGLLLHQPADIMALLELESGTTWSPARQRSIEATLLQSGRFTKWNVQAEPIVAGGSALRLKLELTENIFAPLLTEELDDVAITLLKSAEQMSRWQEQGDDLEVHLHVDQLRSVLKSVGAEETPATRFDALPLDVVLQVSHKNDLLLGMLVGPDAQGKNYGYALSIIGGQLRLDSVHRRCSLVAVANTGLTAKLECKWQVPEDASGGHRYGFWIGSGFNVSGNKPNNTQVHLVVHPAFVLNQSRDTASRYEFVEGRLSASHQDAGIAEYDSATGRFLRLQASAPTEQEIGGTIQCRFAPNLLKLPAKSVDEADWQIVSDPGIADVIQFIVEEATLGPLAIKQHATDSKAILWLRLLAGASRELAAAPENESLVSFDIPLDTGVGNSPTVMMAQILSTVNGLAFARQSSLWRFGRETSLLLSTGDQRSMQEIMRLLRSEEAGPLLHLYGAEVFTLINPPATKFFAERGLQLLDGDAIRQELPMIVGPETKLGQMLLQLVQHLRALPPEERALLLDVFPEELERQALEQACVNSALSDQELVGLLTVSAWNNWVRELVRERFLHHAPVVQRAGG